MSQRPIGVVGDSSTPTEVDVKALHPIPAGTYIYIRFKVKDPVSGDEVFREVVGIIGSSMYRSVIPIITTPGLGAYESPSSDLKRESYMKALIIADISSGRAEAPRHPPPPETPVYLAQVNHLRPIYSYNAETSVRVGTLVGFEEIEVMVDVNALAKHLLVTGTTGSGKSNLVAVLADRIAQMGGSVVIFDVHGEYRGLESECKDEVAVVTYDAGINLIKSPIRLLARFIIPEAAATKQIRILRNALKKLNEEVVEYSLKSKLPYSESVKRIFNEKVKGKTSHLKDINALDMYKELLKKYVGEVGVHADDKTLDYIRDKVEDFFEWHRVGLDTPEVSELVDRGKIIVADVSTLTDDEKDYMLKVIAEDLLWALKERKIVPTLLVVEEAHIFLSRDVTTRSKETLQRFIREGRKFGGMLAIVSQRPRALDANIVSQVQNYAFLKLVQRGDKSVVMELTDILSEEYVNILPTLPPGHGILIGEWVGKYPVYVKIDMHRGKRVGATPDIVGIWRLGLANKSKLLDIKSLSSEWEG